MINFKQYPCSIESVDSWEAFISIHSNSLAKSLTKSLEKVFDQWRSRRRDKLYFIHINFLRSSTFSNKPFFYLTATGSENTLDLIPIHCFWESTILADQLHENIPMPNYKYPKHTDPKAYEIEELWLEETDKMFKAMGNQILFILEKTSFQKFEDKNIVTFFYGEYLDREILIDM